MVTPKFMYTASGDVLKLKKTLYVCKESPHIRFELFEREMKEARLQSLRSAACVFKDGVFLVVCSADDLLIMADNISILSEIKKRLAQLLPANTLGEAVYYLGVNRIRERGNYVTLLRQKYVQTLAEGLGL